MNITMLYGNEFTPWSYERPDGNAATVYGNQYAAIRFDGSRFNPVGHEEQTQEGTRKRVTGKVVDSLFAKDQVEVGNSTVAEWREIAGPAFVPGRTPCMECSSGKKLCGDCGHECGCKCDECGGTSEIVEPWPDRPYVCVKGKAYDVRLLAPLLALVNGGAITVRMEKSKDKPFLYLHGDGWSIAAASYSGKVEDIVEFPAGGTK